MLRFVFKEHKRKNCNYVILEGKVIKKKVIENFEHLFFSETHKKLFITYFTNS